MENYKLIIDIHELDPERKFLIPFDKEEINYEVKPLPIGDYIVIKDGETERICFERKTFSDFVGSVKSGRLFQQLINMQNTFEINYLIIVGNYKDYIKACTYNKREAPSVNWYLSTVAAINVRYPVKVLMVNNHSEMVKLMRKIIEKTDDGKCIQFIKRLKISTEDIKVNMLTAIDGISLEKAKRILEKYSLFELYNTSEEELKEIRGVGDKIVGNLKKIFVE